MKEILDFPPADEGKIFPGQTFLLAEPVTKAPTDSLDKSVWDMPHQSEGWIRGLRGQNVTSEELQYGLAHEYLDIAHSLKSNGVPFRFIIAHDDMIDESIKLTMLLGYRIRGVKLNPSISSTTFPRDMLADFDGKLFINRAANFRVPDGSGRISRLGEGGAVLRVGKKVFLPSHEAFSRATRREWDKEISRIPNDFDVQFLPCPTGLGIDFEKEEKEDFLATHLDRVAAFIKGGDGNDYLLVDSNYMNEERHPWGEYSNYIEQSCEELDVRLVVINREPRHIPLALNLVQFADNSVFMTAGDEDLRSAVSEIAGEKKVFTTKYPVALYPLVRRGGIRCMTLFEPSRLVLPGPSLTS